MTAIDKTSQTSQRMIPNKLVELVKPFDDDRHSSLQL